VRAALRVHHSTEHCSVRVTANAGLVQLHGTVDYVEQSEACSDIAKGIKGVRVIENHLHIAETGSPQDS
jgi:osmotically-inducible protein OsmY